MKHGSNLLHVINTAIKIWPEFLKENKSSLSDRGGIYLIGTDLSNKNTSGLLLGEMVESKVYIKMQLAFEKLGRLLTGPAKHYTSFATANSFKNRYGGAIRTSTFGLSGSGLPQEYNHAFVLRVLKASSNCNEQEYAHIEKEFELCKNFGV